MSAFETITVHSMVAACDGGGGALGHPKVYLNLSAEGQVECPYCSRLFVLYAGSADGHGVETGATHQPPSQPEPASPGLAPASPATSGAMSSSANLAKQ
jgi:uncharacterized Zn-finger protein